MRTAQAAKGRKKVRREVGPPSPQWDAAARELQFGDMDKHFSATATCICAVLSAFAAAGWPPSIPNPFDGESADWRLQNVVAALRADAAVKGRLWFGRDGKGGVSWRPVKQTQA